MGNESSTLHPGTIHPDKGSIERALILYHHSLAGPTGVSHRWIKSEKKRIQAVCVHQAIAISENRKLKHDIAKHSTSVILPNFLSNPRLCAEEKSMRLV